MIKFSRCFFDSTHVLSQYIYLRAEAHLVARILCLCDRWLEETVIRPFMTPCTAAIGEIHAKIRLNGKKGTGLLLLMNSINNLSSRALKHSPHDVQERLKQELHDLGLQARASRLNVIVRFDHADNLVH